jgi:hypothetical protein
VIEVEHQTQAGAIYRGHERPRVFRTAEWRSRMIDRKIQVLQNKGDAVSFAEVAMANKSRGLSEARIVPIEVLGRKRP